MRSLTSRPWVLVFVSGLVAGVVAEASLSFFRLANPKALPLEEFTGSLFLRQPGIGTMMLGTMVLILLSGLGAFIYAAIFKYLLRGAGGVGLGVIFGWLHSLASGFALGWFSDLGSGVRAPGYFGLEWGAEPATALMLAPVIYGAIVGVAYERIQRSASVTRLEIQPPERHKKAA